jgi:hypothetical protein
MLFCLNQLSFDDHILGMHPRKSSRLCEDTHIRATDLIAYAALSAAEIDDLGELGESKRMRECVQVPAQRGVMHCDCEPRKTCPGDRFLKPFKKYYVQPHSTGDKPNHDCNYVAFTVDYPDAAKPSIGVTVHPLSQCYCRYLVCRSCAIQQFAFTTSHAAD